jgi:hypothetical protein
MYVHVQFSQSFLDETMNSCTIPYLFISLILFFVLFSIDHKFQRKGHDQCVYALLRSGKVFVGKRNVHKQNAFDATTLGYLQLLRDTELQKEVKRTREVFASVALEAIDQHLKRKVFHKDCMMIIMQYMPELEEDTIQSLYVIST